MKCNKCGKDVLDRSVPCPHCSYRVPKVIKEAKEMKESKDSHNTLIEFPSNSRNSDWRAELSERVRQVKERRNMQEARGRLQAELEAAQQRYQQTAQPAPAPATVTNLNINQHKNNVDNNSDDDPDRHPHPVIEAALKRARRASEVAGKRQMITPGSSSAATAAKLAPQVQVQAQAQTQPQIQNQPQMQTQSLARPRTATAPLTEPLKFEVPEVEQRLAQALSVESVASNIAPQVTKSVAPSNRLPAIESFINLSEDENADFLEIAQQQNLENAPFNAGMVALDEASERQYVSDYQLDQLDQLEHHDASKERPVRVIKESDTGSNYLDELIAVCEQNLSNDPANYSQHFIALVVDLLISVVAAAPFWAICYGFKINLHDHHTLMMLGSVSLFITIFYLTSTVMMLSRTFGMMFVGTHVINSNNGTVPSLLQSMMRSIGYFLSIGLAGFGLIWIFVDKENRGLHDIISSTQVVRDY